MPQSPYRTSRHCVIPKLTHVRHESVGLICNAVKISDIYKLEMHASVHLIASIRTCRDRDVEIIFRTVR